MTYYTTTYNGTFQGGLSAVQGGDFYLILQYSSAVFDESSIWTGFASGALSSIASSAFMGGSSFDANGKIAGSGIKGVAGSLGMGQTAGTLAFGAIAGGAGAALTGGNFWQGAVTGLVVAGLNHLAHGGFAKKNGELLIFDDTDRVHGNGHTSIAGKIDDTNYEYVSSEGRVDTDGNAIVGGKSEVTHKYFTSKDKLLNSDQIVKGGYDKYITIKGLTYSQVKTAMRNGLQQANSYYHFMFSNCFHVVAKALESINLYSGSYGTFIPNNGFYDIYYHYNPIKK